MKAIVQDRFGPPDVLQLVDVDADGLTLGLAGAIDQSNLPGWGGIERSFFLGYPPDGPVSVYAVSGRGVTAHDLGTLEVPEPSADLVARTLARIRLADMVTAEPYRWDAINIYNDNADARGAAPLYPSGPPGGFGLLPAPPFAKKKMSLSDSRSRGKSAGSISARP